MGMTQHKWKYSVKREIWQGANISQTTVEGSCTKIRDENASEKQQMLFVQNKQVRSSSFYIQSIWTLRSKFSTQRIQ